MSVMSARRPLKNRKQIADYFVRRIITAVLCVFAVVFCASCGSVDSRTKITVWSWEPSMKRIAADFEAKSRYSR